MKKIKVIQIGIGHDHATAILDDMLGHSETFEVVGLALPENEREKYKSRWEKYNSLKLMTVDEALDNNKADAIVIETEEISLTKYALMAVEHDFDVHMDKPGGFDVDLFKNLIKTAKERNKILHLGYMYRYNPAVQKLFEKADNGELGEIYSVEAHMDCCHDSDKRQWLDIFPRGMMFYLGCHLIDLIYRIQGKPREIIPMSMSTGLDGVAAQDYGMALFKYKNGISFAKACAAEFGGYMRRQVGCMRFKGNSGD